MNNSEREAFDKKVLTFFKAKGTLCPSDVARHFKKKWETAHNSILRLVEKGLIFYHPEISRSPKCYSIWPDHADNVNQRYFDDGQQVKNGNHTVKSTNTTFDSSLFDSGIVRGKPVQIVEKRGFVCHPSMKGKDVPRTFIRGHIHGQYFAEIVEVGKMPETFIIPDTEITGGWTERPMKGNQCYFGHINLPEDPKKFNIHAMANKKGELKGLSVYVHPRYIYHENNAGTAASEFRMQVKDILKVLEYYGWKFGSIVCKGTYSMAINDPILASHVPKCHVEPEGSSVLYDSSPMSADGVCTEAEILNDHPTAEAEADLMVNLPQRIWSMESTGKRLEGKIIELNSSVNAMADLLSNAIPHMDNLTKTVRDLTLVTEFNSNVLFGTTDPLASSQPYIGKAESKGDAMYG